MVASLLLTRGDAATAAVTPPSYVVHIPKLPTLSIVTRRASDFSERRLACDLEG